MPRIRVPLARGEADVVLDLQIVFDRCDSAKKSLLKSLGTVYFFTVRLRCNSRIIKPAL